MTATARSHILIMGDPVRKEALANAAITPGDIVERMSNGKVRRHATADGNACPLVALEVDFYGGGTGAGLAIDQDYAADEKVMLAYLRPGDEFWGRVAAGAAAIAIGDRLVSAGNGTLKKYTAQATNEGGAGTYTIQTDAIVGVARQAVDNSGGGSAARIRVEVA